VARPKRRAKRPEPPAGFVPLAEVVAWTEAIRPPLERWNVATETHDVIEDAGRRGIPIALARRCKDGNPGGGWVAPPQNDWLRMTFPFRSQDHPHDLFWVEGDAPAYVEVMVNVEAWRRLVTAAPDAPPGLRQAVEAAMLALRPPLAPAGRAADVFTAFLDFFEKLKPEEKAWSGRKLVRRYKDEGGIGNPEYIRKEIVPVVKGRRLPRKPKRKPTPKP
jgi:hypothetical protein